MQSRQESTATETQVTPTYTRGLVQLLFKESITEGTELFFTTNPGLEDVVAEEFHQRTLAAGLEDTVLELTPFGLGGHVLARSPHPFEKLEPIARKMRSIHHLLRPLYGFTLPEEEPLKAIYGELQKLEIAEMRTASSFRVTTKRVGKHAFTSMDVQREAGTGLVEHYGCAVDLENFELNVRVDVYEKICVVSLQLTQKALSKRQRGVYRPRTVLRKSVAYAMLQFARLGEGKGALLDPFCGSGTILIEAAQIFPKLELYGCDLFPEAVDGARLNVESLSLKKRIEIRQADARALGRMFPPEHFHAIVTNPPYGVRLGQNLNFASFYRVFLEQAWKVLKPGGLLVMLAWKRGVFTRVVQQHGRFRRRHVRVVEMGHLFPRIFVLEKPEAQA